MFDYIIKVLYYPLVFFIVFEATTKVNVQARPPLGTPAVDFTRHAVVRPIVYHGRTKREINSTRDVAGDHRKQVTVSVDLHGDEYVLDLALNENLLSKNHVISYQTNGQTILHKPNKEELDICQYSGTVRGKPGSRVAVSTCRGISGVIYDGNTMKYIEPAGGNAIDGQHFIYDHADLTTSHHHVGNKSERGAHHLLKLSEQIRQRSQVSRSKRETDIAINQTRYLELAMVADHREFKANGESIENVQRTFQDITNILNFMFAPLNINITLAAVTIWNKQDAIHLDENYNVTLDNFIEYRDTMSFPDTEIDYVHMLTHQLFADSVGGMSLLRSICFGKYSSGVSTRLSDVTGVVVAAIAHELGHSLGMDHDSESCDCPSEYCIMNSGINPYLAPPTHWSSCSRSSLARTYALGLDFCLHNPPGSLCGNNVVEAGEQCDCPQDAQDAVGLIRALLCHACCHPLYCTLNDECTKQAKTF